MSKFKPGDRVKIKRKHFNKYYGDFDQLEEWNRYPSGNNKRLFDDCLAQFIACAGIGIVTGYVNDDCVSVTFSTKYFGEDYSYSHYFNNDGLKRVKLSKIR